MNIQAKFAEIREATENARAMLDGLKGLGEHIFPQAKLEERVNTAMEIHIDTFENMQIAHQEAFVSTLAKCEQMTNEVAQLANSITARYESRFQALERDISEMKDMLEGFVQAASRRRK